MSGKISPDHLYYQGRTYLLDQYMTVADYAAKYNVSINTLHSRLKRSSLPVGMVLDIPRLGLKLLRDMPYEPLPKGPKVEPLLKEKLTPRHIVRQTTPRPPAEEGKPYLLGEAVSFDLLDTVTNEVVYSVGAETMGEAIEWFNRDGQTVNSEGLITGLML